MQKITFIGGGSAKFVRELAVDLFLHEELRDCRITLMDVNRERVEQSGRLVRKIIGDLGIPATVETTLDQRKALDGADFVIITIMVGGYDKYKSDVAIPEKYGVLQTVSDTTGPGGVMRTLRTAPVLREIANDLRDVAPDAWVLNYANPMTMNTLTLLDCGHLRSVGLCHSIQGCAGAIERWLAIPEGELVYTAGGINHRNFYLELRHEGKDVYPRLLEAADRICATDPAERMRFELLRHLGYFPAEGPMHQAEYYPWLAKNRELADFYGAEVYFGWRIDSKMFETRTDEIKAQINGEKPITLQHSAEYGARIIHAILTGEMEKFYGNVRNSGLISNLPPDAIVEVPCIADRTGISPCAVGTIPAQLAAVMTPHLHLSGMAVKGALQGDRDLLRRAIQADPLTSAVLTLPKIDEMTDELLAANEEYTRGWR